MKVTLYENADDFLKDNKKFIYDNSLQADLVFGNAHSSIGKDKGFYGASVKSKNETLLSIQIPPFPRVHFSSCSNPAKMTKALVESYVNNNQIPDVINGDKKTINAMILNLENVGFKYRLHMDLLKRKCKVLNDVSTLTHKIVNSQSIDYNFTNFYIEFYTECNISFSAETVEEKVAQLVSGGNLYALIDKGNVVSVVCSSRKTQHGRAINFVYTPPKYRGKGYSTCCVKQLTDIILKDNKYAFLYSDRSNPIANHIYEKLGFEVFDEFCQYERKSI